MLRLAALFMLLLAALVMLLPAALFMLLLDFDKINLTFEKLGRI